MGRMAYTTIEADVADDALGGGINTRSHSGFRDVQWGHIRFKGKPKLFARSGSISRCPTGTEALFARSDPITRCPTRTRSIEDQPEPFASQRAIGESRN